MSRLSEPLITDEMQHRAEWLPNWQYCEVWRWADPEAPFRVDAEPEGDGWVPNTAKGTNSMAIVVPSWWSAGRPVQHIRSFRRPVPGMRPWQNEAHLHLKVDD